MCESDMLVLIRLETVPGNLRNCNKIYQNMLALRSGKRTYKAKYIDIVLAPKRVFYFRRDIALSLVCITMLLSL